jgi:hypothetical protein
LHNEELYGVVLLTNIIWVMKSRRMRWAGHVACMGKRKGAYRVLMGKPEGKRSLGIPRHRWEYNTKLDLQELGWRAWNRLRCLMILAGGQLLHIQK